MSESGLLNEALALALKLSPKERIQLVEYIAASLEREFDTPPSSEEHWGQALNRLLDALDTSDWEALDIDDAVNWVKKQREEETKRRLGDWGSHE
jgi:putative addiction module component (TIGR02574 family)